MTKQENLLQKLVLGGYFEKGQISDSLSFSGNFSQRRKMDNKSVAMLKRKFGKQGNKLFYDTVQDIRNSIITAVLASGNPVVGMFLKFISWDVVDDAVLKLVGKAPNMARGNPGAKPTTKEETFSVAKRVYATSEQSLGLAQSKGTTNWGSGKPLTGNPEEDFGTSRPSL